MSETSIKKSATINAIANYSVLIMNIFFTGILARILTPDDYGIIAIVTIFTTLFSRISDMGFGTAIIQRKDLSDDDTDNIFSFTFYAALILGSIFAILGYPVSAFYNNGVYKTICLLLAISVFFNTLNMIPGAILLRNKMFKTVGIRTVTVNIAGYGVAIGMAVMGFEYYALVFQSIIASILNFFWNNYTAKCKFKIKFSMKPIKAIFNYSAFQFVFNWVNYFETNLDNILIGGIMGSTPLAFYNQAYKLLAYQVNNLTGVITPVLHPILKDYQDKQDDLLQKYTKIQKLLSVLSILVFAICFCASKELIRIVYGSQWDSAIVAFNLLCFSIYSKIMMSTTGALYCSIGNTRLLFIAGLINAGNTALWIIVGILWGSIEAVAMCVSVANGINMMVTFFILLQNGFKKNIWNFSRNFVCDIGAMVVIAVIPIIIGRLFVLENVLFSLVFKLVIIIVCYLIYLIISKDIIVLFDVLPQKFKEKCPKALLKFIQS